VLIGNESGKPPLNTRRKLPATAAFGAKGRKRKKKHSWGGGQLDSNGGNGDADSSVKGLLRRSTRESSGTPVRKGPRKEEVCESPRCKKNVADSTSEG